jgi:hypothetical protein
MMDGDRVVMWCAPFKLEVRPSGLALLEIGW